MLPIARTALIVVGAPQAFPKNALIDYRFVDYRTAATPEIFQQQLQSDWCYHYDNLLLTYPPCVDANDLSITEAQMDGLNQARQMARLTLPFRLRRLSCSLPGAGFGLTLLTALRHLNKANLPVDVALERIQTEMANIKVQHLFLTPGKGDLAACPALIRWWHRLKPTALMYRSHGNSSATHWRRVKAETAVESLLEEASDALTKDQVSGGLWVLGFPGALLQQLQSPGLLSLVQAVHDQGGIVRYSPEMKEEQYSLAWITGITAPAQP